MSTTWITCPMCGYVYDPDEHIACRSCPLHKNCHLVCCPNCGYESIDPGRSVLAQAVDRWLRLGFMGKSKAREEMHPRSDEE
jgi:hypothetical protein